MAFMVRSKARRFFLQLVTVSISFCVFAFLPLSHLTGLTCVESSEVECPCEDDAANSSEELAVCSSTRRRLHDRRHSELQRRQESGSFPQQIASAAARRPALVGHQLANGLSAPLLI